MKIKFKRLKHDHRLDTPSYATKDSAGLDSPLAQDLQLLALGQRALAPTGLCFAIPRGYEGQIRPHSGFAVRYGLTIVNAPGTIDADYRGELHIPLINLGQEVLDLQRGKRIAQFVIALVVQVRLEELDETERGIQGFGSSGL